MASQNRRFRPTPAFYGHLALFAVVTVGLIVLTLVSGGEFWWYPIVLICGAMVVAHGIGNYSRWRTGGWETGVTETQISTDQQDELDWDRRTAGFRGFGVGGSG